MCGYPFVCAMTASSASGAQSTPTWPAGLTSATRDASGPSRCNVRYANRSLKVAAALIISGVCGRPAANTPAGKASASACRSCQVTARVRNPCRSASCTSSINSTRPRCPSSRAALTVSTISSLKDGSGNAPSADCAGLTVAPSCATPGTPAVMLT
ncbi:Uncharacterised protein [Mycobacteroides abscessus subsp. abscessus]|nr:Uncharacterised protein [Mycobacteroides abscessus subsp. abscessus]